MLKLFLTLALVVQCVRSENEEHTAPKEKQTRQFPFPAENYDRQQQEYLKNLLYFNPQLGYNFNGYYPQDFPPQPDNRGFGVQAPIFYVPGQPEFGYNPQVLAGQSFRPELFGNFGPNVFKQPGLPEKPIFLAGYPKPAHLPTEQPDIKKDVVAKRPTKVRPEKLHAAIKQKPTKLPALQPADKFVILNDPSFYNPYQQFLAPERFFYQPSFKAPQPHIPQDKSPGTLLKDLLPLHLHNQVVNENLVPVVLKKESQELGAQERYSEKDLPVPIYEGNVHPGIAYNYFKTDDIENDAVVIDAKFDDDNEETDKDSEVVEGVTEKPADSSVAQAAPGAIALAGVGGVASAGPRGTALAGEGGLAVSSPHATAVAGPSKDAPEKKTSKPKN